MKNLIRDLRRAVRSLVESPLLSLAAIGSLALGVGAVTAVFSLVNAVFLRGLPVDEPDRLVAVYTSEEGQSYGEYMPFSRPNFLDLKERTDVFSDLAEMYFVGGRLTVEGGSPERVGGQMVSSNFFSALGIRPQTGRLLEDHGRDEIEGAEPFVVLSHRFWTRRFGRDPQILGSTVRINKEPFTVIGVAPPSFVGTMVFANPDFWVPVSMRSTFLPSELLDDRRELATTVIARLAPGVTEERARAALAVLARGLEEEFPDTNRNRDFGVIPLSQLTVPIYVREQFVSAGGLMISLVALVLLVACANVANLLLARAASRRSEIAMRLALGASRWRVVRQLLAESLVLAAAAGLLGLLFGVWGRDLLWAMRPPGMAGSGLEVSIDPRVVGFNLLATFTAALLFGLAPALRASRRDLILDIGKASSSAVGVARLVSFRNFLVVSQVALSFVALAAAGLFVKSYANSARIDTGFEPRGLVALEIDVSYVEDGGRHGALYDEIVERARSVSGVISASLTNLMPLRGNGRWLTVIVEGRDPEDENNRVLVPVGSVGSDLFATLGADVLRGRPIDERDRPGAPAVAVVNEALAGRLWPGQDALGQRFHFLENETVREVVGIVANTDYVRVGEEPQPLAFIPRQQNLLSAMTLAVRVQGGEDELAATLRREIQGLSSGVAVDRVWTGSDLLGERLWSARLGARLLGVLGAVALILAAVGIYGVMAYTTVQRERELTIRMAVGADRRAVFGHVLGHGMKVTGAGLILGVVLALVSGRAISAMLYNVSTSDAAIFAGALTTLLLVALAANLYPATKATRCEEKLSKLCLP